MLSECIAELLGGLGLFFVGIRMVSSNLKLMTSRKFKLFIARFTDSGFMAGLWGALSGFITQSTSVTTFIVASLISSGLISVRKSLPLIFWSNPGCSTLVLIAVLDIKLVVLILLGVSGICYAFEKPKQLRHAVGALFGISLLFLGLSMVSAGASPFAEYPWFKTLLYDMRDSYLLTFLIGTLLAFVSQTSIGIIIIAITMTNAGLLSIEQTLMIIYGTHLGSSITTYVLSSGLKGSAKQPVMAQVCFNVIGVVLFVAMFYVEILAGIPLVRSFVALISDDIRHQAACVVLLFNISVPVVLSFVLNPFCRMLERFWPPLAEEELSRVKYIHEHAVDDPETAVLLIEKELTRLLKRIPLYLDRLRPQENNPGSVGIEGHHAAFAAVSSETEIFISDLFHRDSATVISETLINLQNRHNLINTLEDNCYEMVVSMREKTTHTLSDRLVMNIVESLDALVLTAIDVTQSPDPDDLDIMDRLTSDRGQLMEKIRHTYLSSEQDFTPEERSLILFITSLFERSVWTLGRYGRLLGQTASPS